VRKDEGGQLDTSRRRRRRCRRSRNQLCRLVETGRAGSLSYWVIPTPVGREVGYTVGIKSDTRSATLWSQA